MKKEFLKTKQLLVAVMMAAAAMFVACDKSDDVVDEPDGPSGGGDKVEAVQLQAPAFGEEYLKRLDNTDGTASLEVNWGAVAHVSAYKVDVNLVAKFDETTNTLKAVEPAESKLSVTTDDLTTSTRTLTAPIEYGGKYAVSIVALGDGEEYTDSEAVSAEYFYYIAPNLVAEGAELSAAVKAILDENADAAEVRVALLAGVEYKLDAELDFGRSKVRMFAGEYDDNGVLQESKSRALVTIGGEGIIYTAAGLEIVNVNFDCTGQKFTTSSKPNHGFITMSPVQHEDMIAQPCGSEPEKENGIIENYYLEDPIVVKNCNVKNIAGSFFSPGLNAWAIKEITAENCIFQFNSFGTGENSNDGAGFIDFYQAGGTYLRKNQVWRGACQNLNLKDCTIYNLGDARTYFYRWCNADCKRHFSAEEGSFNMENVTIHGFTSFDKFGNNLGKVKGYLNVWTNCLFYNCSMIDKLINGGNVDGINPDTNHAGFDEGWVAHDNKFNDVEGVFGDSAAKYAKNDAKFTGSKPTELDLTDDAKGGQSFTYSVAAGDPRWAK